MTFEAQEILNKFINRWHIDDVEKLTLQEYVSLKDKDTFCQWVETQTIELGSIKGMTSIKFGIYERRDPTKKPKNYKNDNKYSWLQGYGNNKSEAFEKIKKDIIQIIKLAEIGKFSEIDNILLPNIFKWKVAYLYSNERLIPIFKKDILLKIARSFGLVTNSKTKISEIQKLMISQKPSELDIYEYTNILYEKFRSEKGQEENKSIIKTKRNSKTKRSGATSRNTTPHQRSVNCSYLVEQKHNKIQEALKKLLIDKHGKENVILEENYVDVKLIQPDYLGFYEVKSASYATKCIREALGQILHYSFNDSDKREKKIYVVGQYPANDNEQGYIDFIKDKLMIEFEYLSVEIE